MPACSVSSAAVHVLSARLRDVSCAGEGGPLPGLAEFLAAVPDHRRSQGRRHTLVSILALACAATAAGAKSLVAIAEWAADAPAAVLAALGVRRDPCGGALVVPSETTIRRTLSDTDPAALDEQLAAWLAAATVPEADEAERTRVAVDGKTMRGAVQADGRAVHLLAAMSGGGAVLAQREVGHKTNEITQVKPLLDPLPVNGAVITLDALHCQRETARYIVEDKHADYIFTAVEHASHCSCCLSWRVKQSSLAVSDLDTQAFAASLGEVDGVELAALDLIQHGLAGDAEVAGGLAEGQPAVGCLGPDAVTELLVDADLPGCSGGELLAGDEAVA